jgi:hypothetical protein
MDKAIVIQDEIRNKLIDLVKINPDFEESAKNINNLLYKLRADDLESYKSKELQQTAQNKFDTIVELLSDSVRNNQIPNIQAHALIIKIGDMRQADFNYIANDYLPKMSEHFKGIHESVIQIKKTLDCASGRGEPEIKEKNKFQKVINHILNFRKSNAEIEAKTKIRPR